MEEMGKISCPRLDRSDENGSICFGNDRNYFRQDISSLISVKCIVETFLSICKEKGISHIVRSKIALKKEKGYFWERSSLFLTCVALTKCCEKCGNSRR